MDYMRSIKEQVDLDVLERAGVRLVIISNGSPAMIKSYSSKCFSCFCLMSEYTDAVIGRHI